MNEVRRVNEDHIFGRSMRTLPRNEQAEQALLGAMLANNRAYERVADFLRPVHFADPIHGQIYRVMTSIIGAGGLADAVTVKKHFDNNDGLSEVGGTKYLGELLGAMVGILNAGEYGRAIFEAYQRREIIASLSEALEAAYDGARPLAEVLGAVAGVDAVTTDAPGDKGGDHISVAIDKALAAAERAAKGEGPSGVSTGFFALDDVIGGLGPGTLNVLAGRPGMGKAQPLDAKILMRDGTWRAMGDLRFGDELASIDGAPNRVVAVHERGQRQVYRVTLSDGRSTEVCADHLWRVKYREWSEARIVDTSKLIQMLGSKRYQKRLSVDVVSGHFGGGELALDPYVLGVLLGDGGITAATPRITCPDAEILEAVQARLGGSTEVRRVAGSYAYSLVSHGIPGADMVPGVNGDLRTTHRVRNALVKLGLMGLSSEKKFIPPEYFAASRADRLDLLRGLMDTDGWAEKHGSVRFMSSSQALAEGVQSLVRSLGGLCSIVGKSPRYVVNGEVRPCLPAFMCRIRHPQAQELFSLARKSERAIRGRNAVVSLTVASIVPTRIAETRCITVSHPSSLYVTDEYVVTHNSALGFQIAINVARKGVGVLVLSLEMSVEELGRRALSVASGVPVTQLKRGYHTKKIDALLAARKELATLPLTIDDASGMTAASIRAKARRARRKGPLGLVMIDHLHIVRPEDSDVKQGATWAVGRISGLMKQAAKELDCPVLLLAQLSRAVESRDEKRPVLSDLRQSGDIEQDADTVMFVYRPEYYLSKSAPDTKPGESAERAASRRYAHDAEKERLAGVAEVIVAKNRDGREDVVNLRFDGPSISFSEVTNAPQW